VASRGGIVSGPLATHEVAGLIEGLFGIRR
jgi:hypothetical protein